MGFFDKASDMLGGSDKGIPYKAILSWIDAQGGIQGILDKLRSGGLSAVVDSWISTTVNLPITGKQILDILGNNSVQQLAGKLGVNLDEALSTVSEFLPKIVDSLSSDGTLPEHTDLASAGLDFVKNKLFS